MLRQIQTILPFFAKAPAEHVKNLPQKREVFFNCVYFVIGVSVFSEDFIVLPSITFST